MTLQQHAVFMNIPHTGHMNPTLPLVSRLTAKGCKVSYFVDEAMRSVVEAAGATWYPFRAPADSDFTDIPMKLPESGVRKYVPEGIPKEEYEKMPFAGFVYAAEQILPALIEDLQALEPAPSAIVYDPFLALAQVAAHVLRIPTVATMTMPGPGVLDFPDDVKQAWDSKEWIAGPAQAILKTYNYDILKTGSLMEFYSSTLNLVTTVDELFAPPRPGRQSHLFGKTPFRCVGALKDMNVKRLSNANVKPESKSCADDLPMQEIDNALSCGRRLLYISLGTVATADHRWTHPFGPVGASNGLAEITGKQLVQHVFRCCFEAVGENDDFLVILSVGPQSDALEGLTPIPSNFIVRSAVPQLDVLQRCSAFLTHGGANSMHESLSFGIPMAVVPIFGDQPANADSVVRCGAGLAFKQPMSSVSAESLRSGLLQLAAEDSSYRAAAKIMAKKMLEAGGIEAAAKAILELANNGVGACEGNLGGA
eukprot:TRINITY_DN4591_c0_g1_i1.p1 TRINITY_DN4591_c0_g1~~TRINITY_DN4591_c0_g1_i1.p1  ORF type:complete len:480 (-),score=82.33 TRINITY_DN4591_c0_g1_i1:223-1662(-)